MNPELVETAASTRLSILWKRWHPFILGTVIFLFVLGIGHYSTSLEARRIAAEQHASILDYAATLRLRLIQELSNVIYLSSGLSSYIAVRHNSLDSSEIAEILSRLYAEARHVRNFGLAVGTTLTYVYPIKGNEAAIGLRYPDLPAQWPAVKAVIESGKPAIAGPMKLVQGGQGLIYRLPIIINGEYWGLLSTVVNSDSFFAAALAGTDSGEFEFSLRGTNAQGRRGGAMFGEEKLFDEPGTEVIDIAVPGGTWALAIKRRPAVSDSALLWQARAMVLLLALLGGWYVYYFFAQRSRLERMALYDSLTGLPNRRLIEDRAQHAVSRQRRAGGEGRGTVAAIMLFDLNGFKPVNDRYGHKAGDMVLREIGKRVSQTMRATDTVGRWGGDEFVVILQDVERQRVPEVADRIRETVGLPIPYDSQTLQVGVAIGIAINPDDGDSVPELLRLADQRMYRSKPQRRGDAT